MPAEMVKKCPECGSINLFFNREKGEIICRDCGLVIEDKMVDFGQEWREGEDSRERKGRAGAYPNLKVKSDTVVWMII